MTEELYQIQKKILTHGKKLKAEMVIDGYSRFFLLVNDNKPKVALYIENGMSNEKYNRQHLDKPLMYIMPHVFCHTVAPQYLKKS